MANGPHRTGATGHKAADDERAADERADDEDPPANRPADRAGRRTGWAGTPRTA